MFTRFRPRAVARVLLVSAGLVALSGAGLAASASMSPRMQEGSPVPLRPAHMHRGSCAAGGDLLVHLTDVAEPPPQTASAPGGGSTATFGVAIPVSESSTTIPIALADLLAGPASIEVHESASEPADVVSCGDLGGPVLDGELVVGLAPVEPRGVPGIAMLRAKGESTVVSIFLVEGLRASAGGPASTATSAATSVETVTVTLGGPAGEFTISASQTTFQVGVPYRFVVTNSGVIPHEFLIVPSALVQGESRDVEAIHLAALGVIDEEDLPSGSTGAIDVVFTEPAPAGTLEFVCELAGHREGGMHLSIEVVS